MNISISEEQFHHHRTPAIFTCQVEKALPILHTHTIESILLQQSYPWSVLHCSPRFQWICRHPSPSGFVQFWSGPSHMPLAEVSIPTYCFAHYPRPQPYTIINIDCLHLQQNLVRYHTPGELWIFPHSPHPSRLWASLLCVQPKSVIMRAHGLCATVLVCMVFNSYATTTKYSEDKARQVYTLNHWVGVRDTHVTYLYLYYGNTLDLWPQAAGPSGRWIRYCCCCNQVPHIHRCMVLAEQQW